MTPVIDRCTIPAMGDNEYKDHARAIKAHRLAVAMAKYGARTNASPAEWASIGMDDYARAYMAKLVGVRVPSAETWALAVDMLRADMEPLTKEPHG